MGGLGGLSTFQAAEEFLRAQLGRLSAPMPLEIFQKSDELADEFDGIIFARFTGAAARECAVSKLRGAKLECNGNNVWGNTDRPVSTRVPLKLLFGLKKLLVSWEYSKRKIRIGEDAMLLSFCEMPVISVCCKASKLELDWQSEEWKRWEELHNDPAFKRLLAACSSILERAADKAGKGEGKGK